MLMYNKHKKYQKLKTTNRFLVSITVLGSAGPIRFVVKEDETVANVIDYALKCYAREGRLPLLGSNSSFFILYCPYSAAEAFDPWGKIGSTGSRNFVLSKKLETQNLEDCHDNHNPEDLWEVEGLAQQVSWPYGSFPLDHSLKAFSISGFLFWFCCQRTTFLL